MLGSASLYEALRLLVTVLLLIGVLPQSGSPAGSARKQRDKIECEACNWVVEQLDEVLESIAVGQNWDDDVRVILFVVLRPGVKLDEDLGARIRKQIRANTTPRHVPAKILAVPDIPRTKSGKIVELAVRSIIHGEQVKNTDALANPESLAHFRGIKERNAE